MAEAVAAVGLAASVMQLIDLSARIRPEINKLAGTKGVPESLKNVLNRVVYLLKTLDMASKAIQFLIRTSSLDVAVTGDLQAIVVSCTEQIYDIARPVLKVVQRSSDLSIKVRSIALRMWATDRRLVLQTGELEHRIHNLQLFLSVASLSAVRQSEAAADLCTPTSRESWRLEPLIVTSEILVSLRAMGRLKEATDILEECVSFSRKTLGADHPDTVAALQDCLSWNMELMRQYEHIDSDAIAAVPSPGEDSNNDNHGAEHFNGASYVAESSRVPPPIKGSSWKFVSDEGAEMSARRMVEYIATRSTSPVVSLPEPGSASSTLESTLEIQSNYEAVSGLSL